MSKSQNPTKEVIPIMKMRIYRRTSVNDFQPLSISYPNLGGKLVFAIDVVKVDMVAALARDDGRVLQTNCWKAPEQNSTVLSILPSRAISKSPSAGHHACANYCGSRSSVGFRPIPSPTPGINEKNSGTVAVPRERPLR
jgi:hypothetical protein